MLEVCKEISNNRLPAVRSTGPVLVNISDIENNNLCTCIIDLQCREIKVSFWCCTK